MPFCLDRVTALQLALYDSGHFYRDMHRNIIFVRLNMEKYRTQGRAWGDMRAVLPNLLLPITGKPRSHSIVHQR